MVGCLLQASAQPRKQRSAAEIKMALQKLQVCGSVLYLAAHPDDENTRLIAYLSNERKVRTGYLSLTRGDGGQNLIGPEKGAEMGVIRTQELLEARKLDGGEQFFTRAVDFGYSKSADETMEIWDKKAILADVVWTIRKFRPDVIVTRFPPTKRAGHGHHTASAMLAEEAFAMAGDPSMFPEQLKYVEVWKPHRLLFNSSTWWDKSLTDLTDAQKKEQGYVTVDIGTYNPLMGKSYSELAAESRSMHKSQGFGSSKARGSKLEFLKHTLGAQADSDLMDGIAISWERIPGAAAIGVMLKSAEENYDYEHPETIIPILIRAYILLQEFPKNHYVQLKQAEIKNLILDLSGVWIEAASKQPVVAYGDVVEITATSINRSSVPMKLVEIEFQGKKKSVNQLLEQNIILETEGETKVSATDGTQAYYLRAPFVGTFSVEDPTWIGAPENPKRITATFKLEVEGQVLDYEIPVLYKWTDRVEGELYRPLAVVPPVTANLAQKVYLFPENLPGVVKVSLRAHTKGASGKLNLELPKGWTCEPLTASFAFAEKDDEKQFSFIVKPSRDTPVGAIGTKVQSGTGNFDASFKEITYPHIATQTMITAASAKGVSLDIRKTGTRIAYIKGAGDEVPESLEQLGYEVDVMEAEAIRTADLKSYQAVITGIRAYNTANSLKQVQPLLMEYVKNGGRVIVQYNTNRGLVTEQLGPYPFELSRSRVTDEFAPVTFLDANHRLMREPNKITKRDFDGWVQERGLYFAGEWDERYTPLFSWNDKGEDPQEGALLVTEYGEGFYIFSGISFFRQLPAGVPGAYRLFVNMISIDQPAQRDE